MRSIGTSGREKLNSPSIGRGVQGGSPVLSQAICFPGEIVYQIDVGRQH